MSEAEELQVVTLAPSRELQREFITYSDRTAIVVGVRIVDLRGYVAAVTALPREAG